MEGSVLHPARVAAANNVTSLLGHPYVLPNYLDKRGPAVTFIALIAAEAGAARVEVTGTRVVFGLVLHRQVLGDRPFARRHTWVISEPTTGCRVSTGGTRQEALDALAERVAFLGGEAAFEQAMAHGIQLATKESGEARRG